MRYIDGFLIPVTPAKKEACPTSSACHAWSMSTRQPLAQLRNEAKQRGIRGRSGMNKAQLEHVLAR